MLTPAYHIGVATPGREPEWVREEIKESARSFGENEAG